VDDALRRQLAAAVGTSGMGSGGVVHPANVAQAKEVLAACAAAGVAVVPRGSTSDGAAPAVVVDAANLNAIVVDATALLLHAGAGATWAAVREAAAARRLAVSGLPNVHSDTVGDAVSLGEVAHRTVAGLILLTHGGELISAGGRTLKDVVGYDLAGLALGSGGRLGLILSVTLRLDPAGAGVPAQPGPGPWRGDEVVDLDSAFAR
jgi:FAD/FMN-containing dehydrogenase